MNDEFFDVVDDEDNVIGRESRSEVHRRGLKHRAVHVLVFNSRGELFLQKRSHTKDTFPGAWDSSASGHLSCGEEYDECALRELEEEIGVKPAAPPLRLFKIMACAETGQEHVWVYRCDCDQTPVINLDEIERGEWSSSAEITRWIAEKPDDFASSFPKIWQLFQEEVIRSR